MAQNSKVPDVALYDRELEVLKYRRAGMTWDEIAQRTGYADPSGPYNAYKRVIKRTQQQPADELRMQELDRIDRMQLAMWPKALEGDSKAILTIVRLMERRAKLLGLDMPIKIEQEVTTWTGDDSIDRAVKDLAALLTANNADSPSTGAMAEYVSESQPITTGNELENLVNSLGSRVGQDENGRGVDSLEGPNPA